MNQTTARNTLGVLVVSTAFAFMSTPMASADSLPQCATIFSLNCQGTFINHQSGDGFAQVVNGGTPGGTFTQSPTWPILDSSTVAQIASLRTYADRCDSERADLGNSLSQAQQNVADLAAANGQQARMIARQAAMIRHLERRLHHR